MRLGRLKRRHVVYWVLGPLPVLSETITGAVVGVVDNPTQGVVPNAVVRARNISTAAEHTTATDQNGYYRPFLELVPSGGRILDAGCGPGRDSWTADTTS